jgi:hypothetical protein
MPQAGMQGFPALTVDKKIGTADRIKVFIKFTKV